MLMKRVKRFLNNLMGILLWVPFLFVVFGFILFMAAFHNTKLGKTVVKKIGEKAEFYRRRAKEMDLIRQQNYVKLLKSPKYVKENETYMNVKVKMPTRKFCLSPESSVEIFDEILSWNHISPN